MAYVDQVFKKMVIDIFENGVSDYGMNVRPRWEDGTPAYTIKKFGVVNRYDLSKEFPAPTLRPVNFKACVDEILWIWQKKSNNINDLNSHIWDNWADSTGSIGKAYGYQVAKKTQEIQVLDDGIVEDIIVDQTDYILHELKHNPSSRRIIANLYNIDELNQMHLAPCCYSITLNVCDGKLNMLLNQRSSDVVVAGEWNVVQYAVLQHMLARVSELRVGELVHVIADCHIYNRHESIAQELLSREEYPAPIFWINPEIRDFYDFRLEDFQLLGYDYNPQIKGIPVAI